MKKLQLHGKYGEGNFALIDDDIFEIVNEYKWSLRKGYVVSTMSHHKDRKIGIRHKVINLHHIVLPFNEGMDIDHKNRNRLDNRRSNLRHIKRSVNSLNGKLRKQNTSGHRGVGWDKAAHKWKASIKLNYKQITIGRYKTFEEAVRARKNFERSKGIIVYD